MQSNTETIGLINLGYARMFIIFSCLFQFLRLAWGGDSVPPTVKFAFEQVHKGVFIVKDSCYCNTFAESVPKPLKQIICTKSIVL